MKFARTSMLTNREIAELLAMKADALSYPLQRAFRRAGRSAFLWQEEVADLLRQNRSLTELPGIGPYLEKEIRPWCLAPPPVPPAPELRKYFLTSTEAREI